MEKFRMTKVRFLLVFLSILVMLGGICASSIIDSVKSGTIVVKQAAWTGTMTAHFKEGVFWQIFGALERYPRSETYYFSAFTDEGQQIDESIPVTFKNGSIGTVSGSVRYTYPLSEEPMISVHRRYKSDRSVKNDLVRTEVRKLVNMTASLMSPEAAMTQKGLFLQMLTDQIIYGQYETEKYKERFEDPITKEVRIRDAVKVKADKDGNPVRMANPFITWKVEIDQIVIQQIDPDNTTKGMIAKRRDAEMKVMVAKADVEKAEQEKKKVEAEGKKAVAEKQYAALQEKMTATVNAEREKEVAKITAQKLVDVAELEKQESQIRLEKAKLDAAKKKELANAEAYAREKILKADNALEKKLETWLEAQKVWAEAYKTRKVPQIVMEGGQQGANDTDSTTMLFMKMLGLKAARDLALDMNVDANQKSGN